jgi:hypothetical protein
VQGSGDLTASTLQAQHARLLMSGPGSVKLGGQVDQFDAVVRGSGSLQGQRLQAARAEVKASGPGNAELVLGGTLTTWDRQGQHPPQ